jgi:hypothetical protein
VSDKKDRANKRKHPNMFSLKNVKNYFELFKFSYTYLFQSKNEKNRSKDVKQEENKNRPASVQ